MFLNKFHKFHKIIPVLKSLFNKAEDLKACNFIKNKLQQMCFPVKFANFLRKTILKNICEWLLLYAEADFQRCSAEVVVQRIKWPVLFRSRVQSWRALHANLIKMALHHRYFSNNFTTGAEQWYWKIHLDGCFWGRIYFGNIPEWLLLKGSCKHIFILEIQIFYISYFDVMLKRKEFLWFFLSKDFGVKCKHTELALNFVQKQYFR